MTEPDDMAAISISETGLMWSPYEHLVHHLMAINAISVGGLHLIRRELKNGTWHGMPPHLEGRRLLLLADVCTALTAATGVPADYFRALGDLPEAVPDDAAGLT